MKLRLLARALLWFALVAPFGILICYLALQSDTLSPVSIFMNQGFVRELFSVLQNNVIQATASAALSVGLGIIGAFGLGWIHQNCGRRISRIAELSALLPNIIPVIVVILAVRKVFPGTSGLPGIVFIHALLNVGLVSFSLQKLFTEKLSRTSWLAYVEGASRSRYFFYGVLPQVRSELTNLFLFVFALSFASFAVPLIIGGSQASTLEVLIWQKIRIEYDWLGAVILSLIQMGLILSVSLFLGRRAAQMSFADPAHHASPLLASVVGVPLSLAPAALVLSGLFTGLCKGLTDLARLPELTAELPSLIAGSFFVALGAGLLTVVFLLLIAFVWPTGFSKKALAGYAAPSTVLTGFALLILWRQTGVASYLKIILGLALITAPSFYRLRWQAALRGLSQQRLTAWTLGASEQKIFIHVIYPQVIHTAFVIGGLSALWAWGDFALSGVVAERSLTLAMVIRSLMESYRSDAATVLIWIMILGGVITFALFKGVGRVLSAQPRS